MVGNRSKRKLKHVAQVQLLVHISRMIENPTAERDADFPFCPDAATDLLHALSQSAARQQLCRSALRATATLEEMFLPGPAAALQRRRSRSPDRTAAGSRSSCSSEYTDNCGIAWTPKLRRGCALLGGVTHQVRGAQLQLEFEIARANDEFDLPPVPMFAAPPPSGWISRFAPLADVFCHDGDGDPVLWLTMSKELKRVGVRERMIQRQPARVSAVELGAPPPPRPVLDVNDAAGGDAGQQLQQQQQPDARVVGVSTPVASEHKGGDNAASAAAADARSNASGDRETDNNDGGAANMNDKAKRRMGKDPFRHADGDGRERFAVLGGSAQQPVLLPTAFSRVVADRAAARSAVHDSFQRIQQLTAELREEVARYSACAEAATVLEEVAPRMAERAARDLAAVRRVSEFLVAACAVATAAPRLVVDMPAAQFEQCVSRYLGLSG